MQEQLKVEGAEIIAIAKAAGFSITTEDLNNHRQNLSMSDDELEGVAGGTGNNTLTNRCKCTGAVCGG
ncbi:MULTISPECIES: Nif11-like leader peptide family RiPP precursor [unclassified Synechococcus]|uniref:Nif11-like leader peptide family RiPP precursor n=1 Tax=unclassified Synechococcus TaxID=2626047 RepID=UPI001E57DF93|nr:MULTISPECIES: Nif11-like leader peptide family RiPP precursor [unclassified Synechococcus]